MTTPVGKASSADRPTPPAGPGLARLVRTWLSAREAADRDPCPTVIAGRDRAHDELTAALRQHARAATLSPYAVGVFSPALGKIAREGDLYRPWAVIDGYRYWWDGGDSFTRTREAWRGGSMEPQSNRVGRVVDRPADLVHLHLERKEAQS